MRRFVRMLIHGTIIALAIVLVQAGTTEKAQAQSKVGWVDLDRILAEYSEFKEAEELFRKDAAVWEAEFDSMQDVYFTKLED